MASAHDIASYLDELLESAARADYPGALNGLQLDHTGPVRRIAAAVDVSRRTLESAISGGANLLVVHHGLFWAGVQRLTGPAFERLRLAISHDLAIYSSHLPLDAHPAFGNNALLAQALALDPSARFARYQNDWIGFRGTCEIKTADLLTRVQTFARTGGGEARFTAFEAARETRHWAICTGAGASTETLREAAAAGVDTLIVGEGPHHTAVEAPELGIVVMYAGHYATETLGVRAIAARVAEQFGLAWEFIHAPTGT